MEGPSPDPDSKECKSMIRATALVGAVVALMAADLSAQERPNFSGSWTLAAGESGVAGGRVGGRRGGAPPADAPGPAGREGRRGGGGGGRGGAFGALISLGQQATIVQDGATLTITRTTQAGELKTVYKLDGSESANTLTGPGGNSLAQVSRATWNGNKLAITTSMDLNGNPVQTTMTLSLDEAGALVVESGGMGRRGGDRGSVTTKYTKG
jgi:hypothetical protein